MAFEDHCCGVESLFDQKAAEKELKKYLKKGARSSTKVMIEQLKTLPEFHSMLDIGGGIGVLQWWAFTIGAQQTTQVDASTGYLNVAAKHAKTLGVEDKRKTLYGDLVELKDQVSEHDIVVLDKVVCCYPDYKLLLGSALSKSKKYFAFSMPLDGIISNLLNRFANLFFTIKGTAYRPYVHSVAEVEQFILQSGFAPMKAQVKFPWHVKLYERVDQ